ncbi:MAG: hypothetical protein UZ15_CFX003002445, partial [Chloroflexi bacterium OLB15]
MLTTLNKLLQVLHRPCDIEEDQTKP